MLSNKSLPTTILIIFVINLASGAEISPVETEFVTAEVEGHAFKVPYFQPGEKPLPDEVREFYKKRIDQTITMGKQIIDISIQGSYKVVIIAKLGPMAIRFLLMSLSLRGQSKKLRSKYNLKHDYQFNKKILGNFIDMIEEGAADKTEANIPGLEKLAGVKSQNVYKSKAARLEVGRRLKLILEGIRQLVFNSPVGFHIDFTEMTIDGKPANDELRELIKFLQKAELDFVLNKVKDVCVKIEASIDEDEKLELAKNKENN